MGMKFYFSPYSTAAVTVDVLAELEHGRPEPIAERIQLDIQKGESRTAEYLAEVNPNGMVPAIVHDGTAIWESAAITMYLGELYGVDASPQLYPAPGPKRGEAMKWISWANAQLAPAASRLSLIVNDVQKCVDKEEEEKAARDKLVKIMAIVDGQLKDKDYLLGSEYTIVDTHVWAFISYPVDYMKVDVSSLPTLSAWRDRIRARPQLKDL